jgi:hypothetical protein
MYSLKENPPHSSHTDRLPLGHTPVSIRALSLVLKLKQGGVQIVPPLFQYPLKQSTLPRLVIPFLKATFLYKPKSANG